MNERDEIVEHNLSRLFARAWQPVRATPEFRARLASRLEGATEIERPVIAFAPPRKLSRRVLAAAAIVIAVSVAYFALRSTKGSASAPEDMLARGSVAIREGGALSWREIQADETRRGFDLSGDAVLHVRTPAQASFRVRDGSSAVVTIEPASAARITIGAAPATHRVDLESGAVQIDNMAAVHEWDVIGTGGGDASLASGVLSARMALCEPAPSQPCTFVLLRRGEARACARTFALQLGVEVALRDGRVLSATLSPTEASTASARTSAAVTNASPADATPEAAAKDGSGRITGTFARAVDAPPLGPYTVSLLRRERLPAVSMPKSFRFDGAERFSIHPVAPGTYDVYVEVRGAAPWRALAVEVAADSESRLDVATNAGSSMRGRVLAHATGKPIENALVIAEDLVPAQVIAFDADGREWSSAARTDANGEFHLAHVPSGAHVLRATARGFAAAWSAPTEPDAAQTIELRLALPGSLAGLVAMDDGRPWPGAIVIASFMRPDGGFSRFSYGMAIADGDGRYAMSDLPAGDYVLLNVLDTQPGRDSTASRQVHVAAGAVTTANIPDAVDGPRFEGRLLDAAGKPAPGLDVTLQPSGVDDGSHWRSQRSGADGRFTFAGLPRGTYTVFVGENLGERFVFVEEIEVPQSGVLTHDVRLGAGSIRGRAAPKEGAIGASFVLLEIAERDRYTFAGRGLTTADGAFAFEHLAPATYRVTVFASRRGFAPCASTDLWIAEQSPRVECTLAVERGASLTVAVRDARGVALPDAALTFVDSAGHTQEFSANDVTGPDGRATIGGIAAGRWTVTARARGATTTREIELLVGDERELVLTMP